MYFMLHLNSYLQNPNITAQSHSLLGKIMWGRNLCLAVIAFALQTSGPIPNAMVMSRVIRAYQRPHKRYQASPCPSAPRLLAGCCRSWNTRCSCDPPAHRRMHASPLLRHRAALDSGGGMGLVLAHVCFGVKNAFRLLWNASWNQNLKKKKEEVFKFPFEKLNSPLGL